MAEVGRQPWVIQDILPTIAAVSQISSFSVQITFWMFFLLFTGLLIAEVTIMTTQIKKGPEELTVAGGQLSEKNQPAKN